MKRKEFIKRSAFAVAAGLPIVTIMQSCGSDDNAAPEEEDEEQDDTGSDGGGSTGSSGNCIDNGTNVSIDANHGHSLVVSKDDVAAATEKTYSIMGDSSHNHDVTITASNFQTLGQNQTITVESNLSTGHTHSVTVSCA